MVNFIAFPHNAELNKKLDPQTGKYVGDENGLTKDQLKSVHEYVKERNAARRNLAIAIRNPDALRRGFSRLARLLALFGQPTSQRIALGIGLLVALFLLLRLPNVALNSNNPGIIGTPQIIIEIEPLKPESTADNFDTNSLTSEPVDPVQTKISNAATRFVSFQPDELEPQDLDPPIEIKEISEKEASATGKNVWSVRATDPQGETITRYVQLVAKRIPRVTPQIEVTQVRDDGTVMRSFAGPDWLSEITVTEEPNTHLLLTVEGTKASRKVRLKSAVLVNQRTQQPVQTANSGSPQNSILASRDHEKTQRPIEPNNSSVEDGITDRPRQPVHLNNSSPQITISGSWDGGRSWEPIPESSHFVDDGRLALRASTVSGDSTVIWRGMFDSPAISISGSEDEGRTWRQLPSDVPHFVDGPKVLRVEKTVNGKTTYRWEGKFIPPEILISGTEDAGRTWRKIPNDSKHFVDGPKVLRVEKTVNGKTTNRWEGKFIPPVFSIAGSEAGGSWVRVANNQNHFVDFPLKLRFQWTVPGKRPSILFQGTAKAA